MKNKRRKLKRNISIPKNWVTREYLTAQDVLKYLTFLKKRGTNLDRITFTHRFADDENSDTTEIVAMGEDLYDSETNNILETIVFYGEE
jgi:hypothetical protein